MAARTPTGSPYVALFRTGAFVRVFTAGLGSIAGSSIAGVCLIWIVFTRTGSAIDVALLGASGIAAAVAFSAFGGTWVDRYDRRRLMVAADFARAAAMAGIALDLVVRGFDLIPILAAYFVVGAFSTVFNPAEQAIVPSLVEAPLVADANGLVRSSRSALQFVGTAVAGALIVTVGPLLGVVLNAATFLGSGLILLGMTLPAHLARPARAAGDRPGYFDDVKAGFRWLYRARGFFQLTLSAMFFNFCAGIIGTFLVIFATLVLHGSALVFAGLLAAEVAGQGLGSLLVGPTHAVRWAGRAWVVPYGSASAVLALLLVLVPSVPVSIALVFGLGLLGGFAGTAWLTAAQLLVPTEMQGRYFGIDAFGSVAILPAAQIGGALLIARYGIGATYLLTAIFWLGTGLLFLVPRAMWNLGYRGPQTPILRTDVDVAGTRGSLGGSRSG